MLRQFSILTTLLLACSSVGSTGDTPSADQSVSFPTDGGSDSPDLAAPIDMALPPAEGKPLWGRSYNAQVEDVAAGADGSIYLTGQFSKADFGDGQVTSNGVNDGFLIKFDSVGQKQWARTFGRAFRDVPRKVTVDKSGNAVVVGYSLRSTNVGSHDAFVAYYDASGNQKFFRTYGGPLEAAVDTSTSTAFASDGSFYVTGGFEDRINFGGGDLVSTGNRDIYLLQLSAAGTHLFSKRWGFTNYDQAGSLSVLPDGDVIVSGTGGYPIDFGDGAVGTDPNVDTFLVRFSAQGTARWSKRFKVSPSSGTVVTAAPDGTLWLAGDTNVAVNLGGGPRPSSTGRGLFSGHFTGAGDHIASYVIASNSSAYVNSIAVDAAGQIVLGGAVEGDMNFGPGPTLAADGNCYFLKQAPNGLVRWAHRFCGSGATYNNQVQGVAVAPNGQVLAGGYVGQASTVGSVTLSPWGFLLTVTQ